MIHRASGPESMPARIARPVIVFLGATALSSLALLGAQALLGIDGRVLALVQFAPAIGALIALAVGRRELWALLPHAVPHRRLGAHMLLALGASAVYAALLAGALLAVAAGDLVGTDPVAGVPFALFALLQFFGALGEEIGWRGVLQPLLEARLARVWASVATGLVWGFWHVQFLTDPLLAALFIASAVALSILLGWVSRGSWWQRAAIAGTIHWLVNLALHVLAGDAVGTMSVTLASAVAATGTAVAVLVLLRFASRRSTGLRRLRR
ncbi:MAG: CPBP family intramembrane glutamic endopeptidase [Microbacterium sp.]